MKGTLVVSHVTLVMSSVVVTLGPVSVTVVGVVLKPYVQEVGFCTLYHTRESFTILYQ